MQSDKLTNNEFLLTCLVGGCVIRWWQILLAKYEDGIVSVEAIGKILLKIREAWEEKEKQEQQQQQQQQYAGPRKIFNNNNNNNNNNNKRTFTLDKQQV